MDRPGLHADGAEGGSDVAPRSTIEIGSGGPVRDGTGREIETYVPGYWLSHCEGFRVDDQDGPLGFVERIVENRGRKPVGLIVAENRAGGRRHHVPILHVAVAQPLRERVALDTSLAELGSVYVSRFSNQWWAYGSSLNASTSR